MEEASQQDDVLAADVLLLRARSSLTLRASLEQRRTYITRRRCAPTSMQKKRRRGSGWRRSRTKLFNADQDPGAASTLRGSEFRIRLVTQGEDRELDVRDLQACDSVRRASSMTNTDGAGGSKARQVPQHRGSRTRRQGLLQLVSLVGVRHAKGVKVLAAANLELGDRRRLLNLDGCKKGTVYRRSRVRRARRALASAAGRGGGTKGALL